MERPSCWIFGYGSLIWRPDFPFLQRQEGWVLGWARRFWQASPDHRGTPQKPGRVVTLVPMLRERCWGVAYEVAPDVRDDVIERLDRREQAGYDRVSTTVYLREGSTSIQGALMYVARADNPCFLGPCARPALLDCLRSSVGPSGTNLDYLRNLAASLRQMGAEDPELFSLADELS